jgi:hypothetical protein
MHLQEAAAGRGVVAPVTKIHQHLLDGPVQGVPIGLAIGLRDIRLGRQPFRVGGLAGIFQIEEGNLNFAG